MSEESVEVVRVGDSCACILRVTQKHIEYVGMTGQKYSIDLEECARNWMRWHDDHAHEFISVSSSSQADVDAWNARCVGERSALDEPHWVEFTNDRRTRFEFRTYEALYEDLLGPLMRNGWHTFDTD
jgi:hypothetical protein